MIKSEKKQTLKKLKSMLVLVSILSCSACKDEIKEEFLNPGTTETYVDGWRVKSYEELKERLGDAKLDENCPFKSRIIVIQKVKNNETLVIENGVTHLPSDMKEETKIYCKSKK